MELILRLRDAFKNGVLEASRRTSTKALFLQDDFHLRKKYHEHGLLEPTNVW